MLKLTFVHQRMIQVLDTYGKGKWEDQHVISLLHDDEIPSEYLARKFSSDNIYHANPIGLHQSYSVIPKRFVAKMLYSIPGSKDF